MAEEHSLSIRPRRTVRSVIAHRYFADLSRNTFFLALARLFADTSTEMLYPVLPIFLTQTLNLSTRRAAAPRLSEGIKRDSQYDNDADDNLLIVGIYIHEHESIQQDSDQNRSNDCTGDSSQATKKTRAADHHGGNNPKFVTLAGHSFR